jgi:hypothetical protein
MNTNQKKLKLVKEGIKTSTLNKMTDSQIDVLFSKLQEQVTQLPAKPSYKVGDKGGTLPPNDKGYAIKKNPADNSVTATPMESKELDEDDTLNVVQDPDATEDGMGMFEEKEIDEKFESKKQQKYFFAKCGDGKTKEQKKWCKMADEFAKDTNFDKLPEKKKETKEGYDDMVKGAYTKIMKSQLGQMMPQPSFGESEIEKEILRIVERHITPKMKKEDLIRLIEGDTKTAPAKPKVNPTKPKHPFKPNPDKKGAPKARKTEMDEDTKTAPAKPKVNPGTKPKHPFQPNPDKKGAPKAMKKELPSFLTFNALGLNKK